MALPPLARKTCRYHAGWQESLCEGSKCMYSSGHALNGKANCALKRTHKLVRDRTVTTEVTHPSPPPATTLASSAYPPSSNTFNPPQEESTALPFPPSALSTAKPELPHPPSTPISWPPA
jgi:hypothetical protein